MDAKKEKLHRMSVRTSKELSQGPEDESKVIIPLESVNHLHSFFWNTRGFVVVTVLVFFALFMNYARNGPNVFQFGNRLFQFNSVINANKAPNLRELIRQTSIRAKQSGALQTIPIARYETITDKHMEFVISVSNAANPTAVKDRVSTLDPALTLDTTTSTTASSTANSGANIVVQKPSTDPLDVSTMNSDLVVFDYQKDFHLPYSIVLNKFNTVRDHCLLVTNSYLSQVAPLTPSDLSLWYTILDSINGVGFYNSNLLAGASQAHKHMQFIPLDETWKFRNADAQYGLPIEDFIMPNIESGKWKPLQCSVGEHVKTTSSSAARQTRSKQHHIYTLPQFDFEHSIAVLKVSGDFKSVQAHGDYLRCVYERLLQISRINIDHLYQCSGTSADERDYNGNNDVVDSKEESGKLRRRMLVSVAGGTNSSEDRAENIIGKFRNKIAYGQHKRNNPSATRELSAKKASVVINTPTDDDNIVFEKQLKAIMSKATTTAATTGTSKAQTAFSTNSGKTSNNRVAKAPSALSMDCLRDTAYNVVLTANYMMVVPRSEKASEGINVNSFGYLGFMMASDQSKLDNIRSQGPLNILKAVSKSKKV